MNWNADVETWPQWWSNSKLCEDTKTFSACMKAMIRKAQDGRHIWTVIWWNPWGPTALFHFLRKARRLYSQVLSNHFCLAKAHLQTHPPIGFLTFPAFLGFCFAYTIWNHNWYQKKKERKEKGANGLCFLQNPNYNSFIMNVFSEKNDLTSYIILIQTLFTINVILHSFV